MGFASSTFTAPLPIDGTIDHRVFEDDSTPGVEQEIFNITLTANQLMKVYQVALDCRAEGRVKVIHEGDLKASFRTGPAMPTGFYSFVLPLTISPSENFTVLFEQVSGTPTMSIAGFAEVTLKSV